MSAHKEPSNIGRVLSFLREWDRGGSTVRCRMVNSFLGKNTGKSLYELELEFADVASLFLARLTTWMRLTYMQGTFLGLQLKAIGIFLSASCHDQYLMEFLDDGGVLTLLVILSQSETNEDDKAEALHLLLTISNAGRKYKEFICEKHGVKIVAECMTMSNTNHTQETGRALMESLSYGNPTYQDQVYKSLIDLMSCTSPKAQQLVLQALRAVQLKQKTAHHSIVKPLLNMLRSPHIEVQTAAINLILDLRHYNVRGLLLSGLVTLLRPIRTEEEQQPKTQETERIEITGSLPEFLQQAAAAKTIRLVAEKDKELSEELLHLGVIQQLLHAMGNRKHTDSQIQASLALKHLVHLFPEIQKHIEGVMGSTLFAAFISKADTLYMNMDERQAESLL
ncbi:hypothetical protein CHARACLAT_006603 [Characodon lateralis]|uniref:Armadillo like helical domain containing 1 n=1 Tax=Characodon lateralis TaxID=208331 RepID=A0ABU7CLW6_9TELE|nr:hypothetical protein [Characodon lateralis]